MRFGGTRGEGGSAGIRTIITIVTSVLMLTLSVLLLFNINDAGPNVKAGTLFGF